jgi:hypothetical protein
VNIKAAGPESPEPLAVPAHNRVWLDVEQRLAPGAPQIRRVVQNTRSQGCQHRTLSLSLKAASCLRSAAFSRTTARWPRLAIGRIETPTGKDYHLFDSFDSPPCPSTGYERIKYSRTTVSVVLVFIGNGARCDAQPNHRDTAWQAGLGILRSHSIIRDLTAACVSFPFVGTVTYLMGAART